jgi:hypothetical protein
MAHLTRKGVPLVSAGLFALACSGSENPRSVEVGAAGTDSAEPAASVAAPAGLKVSSVMIGKRVGAGNLITEPTFQFAPKDTVHVSVATEGRANGTLTAAWRSQSGQILQKTSRPVRAAGGNTAFSLSQPKGLKPGTYKVVVFLDDDSVDTKIFAVGK